MFTQNIGGNTTATNPSVNQNTNRFTSSDFLYDKNGNVTRDRDGVTNQLRTFLFNGENKQTEVRDANNAPIGQYFYDGEGKRVKKVITATGETTIFVYSNGKLVAEYSNNIAGPSEAKIAYTTTDHLGSPRVITDDIGQVRSRRDFLPFGEGVNAGIGGRTGESGQGYSVPTDGVRQKFTGYQKDTETSLDFAEARMYENRFGRFTAVDPLLASGKSANPQTFNRYAYTSNNPIVRIDVNGKDWYYYDDIKVSRGRSFYVRHIYWSDNDLFNKNRWAGGGVFQDSHGKEQGWVALDPYEGRGRTFKTRAEAVDQYQTYLQERNVNASRGFADALAGMATANPLTALLYEWGADAIIGQADPNSNVYTVSNRTTNAMIIVTTAAGGGAAVATLRGARAAEVGAVAAIGQRHHLLTTKIMRAINRHNTLGSLFSRKDARFIYNAADEAAHKGYQAWHRRYDQEVTTWLRKNAKATEEEFVRYLNELHQQPWLRDRIPNVNLGGN